MAHERCPGYRFTGRVPGKIGSKQAGVEPGFRGCAGVNREADARRALAIAR
ncbi:hypothetical protein EV378_0432 [Pseudonocardia endophytica]|uniref:Uncharacterized protein n=1 Tax=Pseudonocardia endophytica TaxID=401976 RepID=A0A4R1HVD2_PSEEN|nr:hypothetical protein EV378_0432 [Pseudonocardia endophytica]